MQAGEEASDDPVDVLLGAGQVFLGHAGLILLAMILQTTIAPEGEWSTMLILMIGASQLLYVGPILVLNWPAPRRRRFWGALTAAAITVLLNGGCWGFVGATLGEM